jgi:hypothetical protein
MLAATKHKLLIFVYTTIVIGLLNVFVVIFDVSIIPDWIATTRIVLFMILLTTLTAAYHLTASKLADGEERTHHYFDLPLSIFATVFTVITIIQVVQDIEQIQSDFNSYKNHAINNYAKTVTIQGWEDTPMQYPELNKTYKKTFALSPKDNPTYMNKSQWEKKFPGIAYIPFEGHEQQWHYAAKFIQQMIIITKIFELEKEFKIENTGSTGDTVFGPYAGWMTSFRMFLKNDIVRNVWEQTASHNTTPAFAAWVKFHITDIIDKEPNFFKNHKNHWHQQVQLILDRNSSKHVNKHEAHI